MQDAGCRVPGIATTCCPCPQHPASCILKKKDPVGSASVPTGSSVQGRIAAPVQGVIRSLRERMAGIAVRAGNNTFGEPRRTILTLRNVPVPARLAARLSLVVVKRAVSRDGQWSPDRGDSFAKIHSGLVADASIVAASDRDPDQCTRRANRRGNFGFRDCGLRISRRNWLIRLSIRNPNPIGNSSPFPTTSIAL